MKRRLWGKFDWILVVLILFLSSFGAVIIYSVNPANFYQQVFFLLIGFLLFFLLALFDYRIFKSLAPFLYFLIVFMLLAVLIIGLEVKGSVRWINIGNFGFQPSEIAKPILIICFSWFLSSFNITKFKNIFLSFILMIIPAFMVFRQPDLGNTIIIFILWMSMIFIAGIKISHLLEGITAFIVSVPLVWYFLHDYQKARITSFFNPSLDPLGSGYHAIQAMIAVGSGEIFGRGLGRGTQSQLQFLPEASTDFIFASLSEELGFIGSILLLIFFSLLIFRLLKFVRVADTLFGSLIIIGIVTMIFGQIVISIGMNLGIIPITGITLPFISYGGSSVISTFISLGLAASIIRLSKNQEVDFRA